MRYLLRSGLFAGACLIGFMVWHSRPIRHAPGILVAMEPMQEDQTQALPDAAGFKLTAVARYSLQARVLGTKRYYSGPTADLVPVDVALGWGKMSDQSVLDGMHLSMSNRFFFYEWESAPPIPPGEIMTHASNNHVIAANSGVARAVSALRTGQIVRLDGWLVDAARSDGFHWSTSRRRDDTGNGACELFYVEHLSATNESESATSNVATITH